MALKEISYVLRSAYFAKLEGAISIGGSMIPVFDAFVPKQAPNFFIVIKETYDADDSLKCGYASDVHCVLDIITRFQLGEGTSRISEEISGQIKALLVPNTITLLPDFKIWNTVNVMNKSLYEETSTGRIIRKILTFKHSIQQLADPIMPPSGFTYTLPFTFA